MERGGVCAQPRICVDGVADLDAGGESFEYCCE